MARTLAERGAFGAKIFRALLRSSGTLGYCIGVQIERFCTAFPVRNTPINTPRFPCGKRKSVARPSDRILVGTGSSLHRKAARASPSGIHPCSPAGDCGAFGVYSVEDRAVLADYEAEGGE